MKNLLKRSLAVFLAAVMLFSPAFLNENMFKAKAQSPYLSDEYIARFIDMFYIAGSIEAEAVEGILRGEREGTIEEIKDISSKLGSVFDIAAGVDIDNTAIQAMGNLSVLTNAINGLFGIIDSYQQMQSTQSAWKKAVDGMNMAVSFF